MIINTPADLRRLDQILSNAKHASVDTETTHKDWRIAKLVGIAFCVDSVPYYVPYHYRTRNLEVTEEAIRSLVEKHFSRTDMLWFTHNGKYDLHVILRNLGVSLKGKLWDGMLAHFVCHESSPKDLKFLTRQYLGRDAITFEDIMERTMQRLRQERLIAVEKRTEELRAGGKKHGGMNKVVAEKIAKEEIPAIEKSNVTMADCTLEEIDEYAAKGDALNTYDLAFVLADRLKREGQWKNFWQVEMTQNQVLYEMEETGILTDQAQILVLRTQQQQKLNELSDELYRLAGRTFNIRSTADLVQIIFYELQLGEPKKFSDKTGLPSVDKKVIQALYMENDHPFLKFLLEYRQAYKIVNTYLEPILDASYGDSRVRTTFNQGTAVTTRLSSSAPNLQNQTKKTEGMEDGSAVRNLYVSPPSMKLVEADQSQAELRMLAHYTQDEGLLETYRNNGDIHAVTQQRLNNCDRRIAKTVIFGLNYGMGYKTLREKLLFDANVRVTVAEAKQYIEDFYAGYPSINVWKEELLRQARRNGYVETLYGRRRHLPDLYSEDRKLRGDAERQAINMPIQGSVAGMVARWLIALHKELPKYGARLLIQVHDSVLVECPEDKVIEVADTIKQIGENIIQLSVPLVVDVSVGDRWGSMVSVEEYKKEVLVG